MKFTYLTNVTTFEELKRQYKQLAFKHHPDRGGNVQDMQRINAEYDELKKLVGNIHETADGKTYTKAENANVPDNFRKIINAIIAFDCKIEICGSWLWVFNAYAYRKELKDLGFFWCSSKKAWAWTDKPTENKYRLSLEEIRRLHGSEVIKEEQNKKLLQVAV
ncbi:MAG: molecular chaperone DnaJ [Candidatus Coproplasma sp.]